MKKTYLFAIATHSFLSIVKLNNQWDLDDIQVLEKGHHYGIGLLNDIENRFIAKGGKQGDQKFTIYRQTESKSLSYEPIEYIHLGGEFRYIHQVSYHQDSLYIANTDFNCIVRLRLDGTFLSKYHFNDYISDENHFNSVFPFNQKSVLCVLHNRGRKLSEVVLLSKSSNNEEKFEIIEKAPTWDYGCHNIYTDGVFLFYNASQAGCFVIVDLKTQRIHRRLNFSGHAKGLSVLDNHIIIGYSDHGDQEMRKTSKGYLAVINRANFEKIKIVDLNHSSLPHPIGNVNEIRCLSHFDHGHYDHALKCESLAKLNLSRNDYRWRLTTKTRKIALRLAKMVPTRLTFSHR